MRIDAHQHFWRLARGDYWWITADKPAIHRDFGPAELAPLLAQAGVERTVLVQCVPTEAETDFLLAVARQAPFVAGVIGWIDFDAPDAAGRVEALAGKTGLLGLRPMMQDIADADWMLSQHLVAPMQAMAQAGLPFDALVTPRHLLSLARFVARYDDLTVVIDHGAKPAIAAGQLTQWAREIRLVASQPGTICKLSGLVTEAQPGWGLEDLKPYVDVLLDAFGPERLMWGSDWPVVNLNGSYGDWWRVSQRLLSHLSAVELDQIYGGVAARIYGIKA